MTHINQRYDSSANWTAANPVLQEGEVGWESNTRKAKLGNGATAWNDLPYAVEPGGAVTSVAGKTGAVTLDRNDVGLSNVNNTADADKPISVAQQAVLDDLVDNVNASLALMAPLASPVLTGDAKAPTPGTSDNDTSIATTAFVKNVLDAAGVHGSKKLVIGNVMIQWGTANINMGGAASATATVTFPTAFSATPTNIQTNVQTGTGNKLMSGLNSAAGNTPTATNFGLVVKTGDGTTSSASPTVHWLAIGPV